MAHRFSCSVTMDKSRRHKIHRNERSSMQHRTCPNGSCHEIYPIATFCRNGKGIDKPTLQKDAAASHDQMARKPNSGYSKLARCYASTLQTEKNLRICNDFKLVRIHQTAQQQDQRLARFDFSATCRRQRQSQILD